MPTGQRRRCRAQSVCQLALGYRSQADWTSLMSLCVNMQQANRSNISSPRFFMMCVFLTYQGSSVYISSVLLVFTAVWCELKSNTQWEYTIYSGDRSYGVFVCVNPDPIARLVWFVWADVKATNQATGDRLKRRVSFCSQGNSGAVWFWHEDRPTTVFVIKDIRFLEIKQQWLTDCGCKSVISVLGLLCINIWHTHHK